MDIEQLAGTKLGNYEIESLLGRGGMGIVYKARQISLSRPVVLKFLPPELSNSREWKERFHREAQASAALAHPNICTIYEIDEADDRVFIAMEYLEGQSLDKKIETSPIDVEEAVNISLRVAEGLRHAHKRGIIHRDIKPANIMLTEDGQTKIMDFGLAKLSGKTRLTKTATIMGTIAYMSPEQARGDKDIGHQTDIWSLGVVLYEMLTGKLPFDAETDTGLIYKIINEAPDSIRNHQSDTPESLVSIIEKTIQKDPQSRYEDAKELVADLESVKLVPTASTDKIAPSIVVLPFVNMSADPDQEYFCDGLAEDLINALTQLQDLRVIARTSAFSFKGQNLDVRAIGRKLDVQAVLEGSVRKAGSRLRITAQLVDTTAGHHLWSEQYNREMDDVFAIQDEITLTIVDKLKPKLLGGEKEKLAGRRAVDLQAYNLYLRGCWFSRQSTQEAHKKAIGCFEQAIEKEPGYAAAYAGLSNCYTVLPFWGPFEPKKTIPKAREAALKAVQLDDNLAEAHRSMALIRSMYDWDWEGGERESERAIELNPGDAVNHQGYAMFLTRIGRHDEAVKEAEKALELDPLSILTNHDAGMVFFYANEQDRAISVLQRTLEMNPNYSLARVYLGMAYWRKAKYEEATAELRKEMEGSSGLEPAAKTGVGLVCALTGRRDECMQIREDLLERSRREYVPALFLAGLSFALEETDRGFEWLDKAYEEHDLFLSFLKVFPLFDVLDLRADPRYIAMLKKIGLDK
jgi:serine/threonine protein kinase